MRLLIRETAARIFVILATCILVPEGAVFLFLMLRNAGRFVDSLSREGPPVWYNLLFGVVQAGAAILCWGGCWLMWSRQHRRNLEKEGRKDRMRRKLTAKETAVKMFLLVMFFLFAYGVAPLVYFAGVVAGIEATAFWWAGVPVLLACLFYVAFLLYPFRQWRR